MPGRTQRIYVWLGPIALVVLFAGLLVGRLLPLPRPTENASQIAAFLSQHATAVRLGALIAMFGGALLAPWVAALANQVREIEGPRSPAAFCQLALSCLIVLEIIIPLMILETAVFRPGRPVAEIQTLSDLCWILLAGLGYTFVVELLLFGLTVWTHAGEQSVFPRWFGTVSLLIALLEVPSNLVVFFKTGPLAWNGLIAWWLVLGAFGVWFVIATVFMLRGAGELDTAPAAATDRSSEVDTDMRSELDRLTADVETMRSQLHEFSLGPTR